jgi:hypothetical protein
MRHLFFKIYIHTVSSLLSHLGGGRRVKCFSCCLISPPPPMTTPTALIFIFSLFLCTRTYIIPFTIFLCTYAFQSSPVLIRMWVRRRGGGHTLLYRVPRFDGEISMAVSNPPPGSSSASTDANTHFNHRFPEFFFTSSYLVPIAPWASRTFLSLSITFS